jgi:hypothetical protein
VRLQDALNKHYFPEVAVLSFMRRYTFSLSDLTEAYPDTSLSHIRYSELAPLFDLDPQLHMQDIATFPLHRARIPTVVFEEIIQDMDMMLHQFGPPTAHDSVS